MTKPFGKESFFKNIDDMERRIAAIEREIHNPILYANTTIPSSPTHGQTFHYIANTSLGNIWHFRYNEESVSSYKWEFLGGAPILAVNNTVDTFTNTSAAVDTNSCQITLPFNGDYQIAQGGRFLNNTAGTHTSSATMRNEVSTGVFASINTFSGMVTRESAIAEWDHSGMAAGDVMAQGFFVSGGTGSADLKFMRVLPRRIG